MKIIVRSLLLSTVLLLLCGLAYPVLLRTIALLVSENKADGSPVRVDGRIVGFRHIGQSFTADRYFNSRPSAVNYNAGAAGASNAAPANPDYLKTVQAHIDTFLVHNPTVQKQQIPAELVTASGSGLDPDLSPEGALVQIPRIARLRRLSESRLSQLVNEHTERPWLGVFGVPTINVLELNLALDRLTSTTSKG